MIEETQPILNVGLIGYLYNLKKIKINILSAEINIHFFALKSDDDM